MRPTRLELSGFTSFRVPTVIDFEDADFFALIGPTGSGKSTIIDAICFALYGSVPRYERQGLVHPVITQGQLEAKVRLDFTIDDVPYTAARVVRRSGKGATTREARLESGDEVLAGNADEVSAKVTSLLGLSFEHFTKCVVLPQGDFARFLHDKPKDRQDLLVKLLNLGLYERMRQLANIRATSTQNQATVVETRLEQDFNYATKESLVEAKGHAARLEKLRKRTVEAAPSLDAFESELRTLESKAADSRRWTRLIEDLEMPDDIGALADEIAGAEKLAKEAEALVKSGSDAVKVATKERKALPEQGPLLTALSAHKQLGALTPKLEEQLKALETVEKTHAKESAALKKAAEALALADDARRAAEDEHRAAHLAASLEPGQPCPVCDQKVGRLPSRKTPSNLAKAGEASDKARAEEIAARQRVDVATNKLTEARAVLKTLLDQVTSLEAEVSAHPDRGALEASLAKIEGAEAKLEKARDDEGAARDDLQAMRESLTLLREQEAEARHDFEAARDELIPLTPPPAKRKSLAADWEELLSWAHGHSKDLTKQLADAEKTIAEVVKKRDKLIGDLQAECSDCEIDVEDGAILEAVVAAHTDAAREVERIAKALEEAKALRRRLKELQAEGDLAHQLGEHLSAKPGRFENWLVNEALERLVEGATKILEELSGGQYALGVNDSGDFQVTDRHNAGEVRSAKTLSGGETFLASLSLALALADQLTDLAAEGAARLEAIFLDEGFGTLDTETLDVVAATVENLAATGRMVGIVTHVRDLAERVPIQFKVTKDTRSSSVERVVA
ncbi:MAG: repair protein SbcC/Rad50 [Actinomycetota bacterium]|nr:repair protein SbcC/Rad50 [Actinomycetota bacterium]